ncbi:undecaprenyl diphosphate synthase family protein [Methanocorpusculum sp. MG]|uniref:Undecaprenyl diphosphate synthase family protein n=1 Tax=Methanocorpusculum petauri TaxID=3002863 RepID=A0ABT4IDD3_9EURY|nr:undecaprenyl diphosphate synthase family protein [Methanocorpusculum petauri]MCZ0859749.1 undecaprenyl diphosphate synthase family protein [Methanocorpusculum petauri]MDE2442962.1 undecaprenyl diphosphate synthase family protein [Methanocorpusculum sp.]
MFYPLYEYLVRRKLDAGLFPKELCFMISEADLLADSGRVEMVVGWCMEFSAIRRIIVHIASRDPSALEGMMPSFRSLAGRASVRLSMPSGEVTFGAGAQEILIVLGRSGREEVTEAIAAIAREGVDPEMITEETIESHLLYQVNPDFVIKTGGSHLTDFLIWQSVYSELFFTDVNWCRFRRLDLLRALRDYQSRVRRYGT